MRVLFAKLAANFVQQKLYRSILTKMVRNLCFFSLFYATNVIFALMSACQKVYNGQTVLLLVNCLIKRRKHLLKPLNKLARNVTNHFGTIPKISQFAIFAKPPNNLLKQIIGQKCDNTYIFSNRKILHYDNSML